MNPGKFYIFKWTKESPFDNFFLFKTENDAVRVIASDYLYPNNEFLLLETFFDYNDRFGEFNLLKIMTKNQIGFIRYRKDYYNFLFFEV